MSSADTIYIFLSGEPKKHFDVGQNMQNITMHDRTLFNAKVIYNLIKILYVKLFQSPVMLFKAPLSFSDQQQWVCECDRCIGVRKGRGLRRKYLITLIAYM